MIDTLLLDLDGTLLGVAQQAFVSSYLGELSKLFSKLGMDSVAATRALRDGTGAMLKNDGSVHNSSRFWTKFSQCLELSDEQCERVRSACDTFYAHEFHAVKAVVTPSNLPLRLVKAMAAKGYTLVLATNPIFPEIASVSRLSWVELLPQYFKLITHYANSTFCKPNLGYYRELLTKIEREPQQCLMVGNSIAEDMCAGELGVNTFLVTDYCEATSETDYAPYRHGSLEELEEYLMTLPALVP